MRKVFLLLILTLPLLLFSQKKTSEIYTISGKILDLETNKPIEDATIIFKGQDSVQIKCGAISNAKGNFSIDVNEGTYYATVEYLSYKSKKLNISTINRDLNIGVVFLEVDTEFLKEVEVLSEKKAIDFKANKMIFNVGKDISASGSSTTEILNNIPSINVNPDGEITLRGQNDVTVMINGRTSTMTKSEALKAIPAGSIENIEVLTSPGAKFKASSTGIINIILKKGKDEGLNASLTTTAGHKDYYGGLLTLNHKSKSINFFTNTSYSHSNPITTSNSKSEFFNMNNSSLFLNEKSEFDSKKNGFISTIGSDFYLSENTTLTSTFNFTKIASNSLGDTNTDFLDNTYTTTAINNRKYDRNFNNEIFEFIVDFEHNFTKEGRKLTSYIQFLKDDETKENNVTNTNATFTNEIYTEIAKLQNLVVDFSYITPFGKASSLSIGYTGEFGEFPIDYMGTFTDKNMDYHENIHATYFEYEYESDKFYFSTGVRGEFQESTLDYLDINSTIDKKHNGIFPSSSINYNFNDTNNINLSFKTGMQRLSPLKMQPYEEKISETSSYKGNETLEPVKFYMLDLSYAFSKLNFTISPNLFFQNYQDFWQDVTYETGEQINGINKLITTPENTGNLNYYGLNITSTLKVNNTLNFTSNLYLVNFDRTGTFETINTANQTIVKNFNNSNWTGSASLLTQIKINNLFDFQINAKHQLKSENLYFSRKARTYASLAINKDLFEKEASINLTVDDLFLSNTTNRDRFDTNYFSKSLIENKYRTILLSFTYRFNQSKKDRRIDFDKKDFTPKY